MIVLRDLPAQPTGQQYVSVLVETCSGLINARGSFHDPVEARNAYLQEIDRVLFRLTYAMPEGTKRALVVTDTYRMIFAADSVSSEHVLRAVTLELDRLIRDFTSLLESVRQQVDYWEGAGTLVLPDTNFYLSSDDDRFLETPELPHALGMPDDHITLVVPIAVIDELDTLKRDRQRRDQARWALRSIEAHSGSLGQRGVLHRRDPHGQADPGPHIDIALVLDPPEHLQSSITDDEIVARGQDVQTMSGQQVHLISYDLGFRLRARAAGLSETKPNPPRTSS